MENEINIEYAVRKDSPNVLKIITVMATVKNFHKSLGVAECSSIDGKIFYFNRLFVPKEYRGRGIGKELLLRLLVEIRKENKILELDINPYGDGGMDYEELEEFYLKYGFVKKKINDEQLGTYYKFFFNAFIS